jgi:predicted nuclease of predicted toxin-antitoxin system
MMALKYYLDEQVQNAIARGLRLLGIDVMTAQEDQHDETPDTVILDRAMKLDRVIFTQDADFLIEAHYRQLSGAPFSGVVYAHQTQVSIGDCVRDLEILAVFYESFEMLSRVEYLPL